MLNEAHEREYQKLMRFFEHYGVDKESIMKQTKMNQPHHEHVAKHGAGILGVAAALAGLEVPPLGQSRTEMLKRRKKNRSRDRMQKESRRKNRVR